MYYNMFYLVHPDINIYFCRKHRKCKYTKKQVYGNNSDSALSVSLWRVDARLLGDKLCLCDWVSEKRKEKIGRRMRNTLHAVYEEGTSEVISTAIIQLDEYFARKRTAFDMPLLLAGTDFQKTVWQELLNIPYGKTVFYGELSRKLGNPKAVRAVAAANGANALSIFIPCHRVVGSNRQLIGYAGGLAAKQGLLALEADSCDGLPNSRVVQLF